MPFLLFNNNREQSYTQTIKCEDEFKSPLVLRSPRVLFPLQKYQKNDGPNLTKSRDTSLYKRTFNDFSSNKA
jgi:hypothetical protein